MLTTEDNGRQRKTAVAFRRESHETNLVLLCPHFVALVWRRRRLLFEFCSAVSQPSIGFNAVVYGSMAAELSCVVRRSSMQLAKHDRNYLWTPGVSQHC